MKINKDYQIKSTDFNMLYKCPRKLKPKYITIHERKSTQTALNTLLFCLKDMSKAGFHIIVDDKEAYQMIPDDLIAYANGDGEYGEGNNNSLSIEICFAQDYESDKYYKAVENAKEIVRQWIKKYNIKEIKTHKDWTGYDCPHRMLKEKIFEKFKKEVLND